MMRRRRVKDFKLCMDYVVDLLSQTLVLGIMLKRLWRPFWVTMRRWSVKDFLLGYLADHAMDSPLLQNSVVSVMFKRLLRLQRCLTMRLWSMKDFLVQYFVEHVMDSPIQSPVFLVMFMRLQRL
jgi:hypothetical protein